MSENSAKNKNYHKVVKSHRAGGGGDVMKPEVYVIATKGVRRRKKGVNIKYKQESEEVTR